LTSKLSMTIDVEDFYEGMAVLGHELPRPAGLVPRLENLVDALEGQQGAPKVTLFVVGRHGPAVRSSLEAFVRTGHEIASHGPDHGRLPESDLVGWLRRGREMLEDLLQVQVVGFRSPRFDIPAHGDLARFRDELAEAGYQYVSDTRRLDGGSPVREAPVMSWKGLRLGGGSYQRVVPYSLLSEAVRQWPGTAVCYYHSYDFDGTTPGIRSVNSTAVARQVVGRSRIAPIFLRLVRRFGSESCLSAAA
jgi:Domain of unknown function (DUF3473)/Polysaccharide deacetylase